MEIMKECFLMVLEGIFGVGLRVVNIGDIGEHMYQINDHKSGMALGVSKRKKKERWRSGFYGVGSRDINIGEPM